ncbi:MAG: SDR family oxidoreductase [Patescibacteria group bacterium]
MRNKNNNLKVIITGCGSKPIRYVYKYQNKPSHDNIPINGTNHKMNIGTATAYYLAKRGINVIMVSRTAKHLEEIKQGLIKLGCKKEKFSYIAADLTTNEGVERLTKKLPKKSYFYWVQSIGVGGGTYKIPNDNIYLPFEQIVPELIATEMGIVTATHRLMLKMVPVFRQQIKNKRKAKIAIITSMSDERGYHFGTTHVAAKHALAGYIEGIKRELKDEGITIIDIRPGAIDTGMYDNPFVRKNVNEISRRTKMWSGHLPIYAHPIEVAKKIYAALFSENSKEVYKILAPHQK